MKKEVLIAVIAGLILGLIITFGIYTANRSLEQQKHKNNQAETVVPSPPSTSTTKTLEITSHQTNDLINQSEITLGGIAWPEAVIAVITEIDEFLLQADQEGIFTINLDLVKGFNELTIIATDETGETQTKDFIITYSTTKIELEENQEETSFKFLPNFTAKAQETSPSPESDLTEKIKERLQETAEEGIDTIKESLEKQASLPRKKAYIGTVESISDASLTLTYKSAKYSVSVSDITDYAKSPGSLENIDTDDFIIALGFVAPDSNTLSAHRITLVSDPSPPPTRQLITGKIEELDGNKITVDSKTLVLSKSTSLTVTSVEDPSVDDLALEDNLFAIATMDKNGDIDKVNTVLVIPGKNNPASLTPTNVEATDSAEATESSETE